MHNLSEEQCGSATNKMIRIEKQDIHSQKQEPVANMKLLPIILLAVACQAYTPITERSWVKFHKVKEPTYEKTPLHREPDIIHATDILIEERISTLSTMVRKSVRDFHAQMKKYMTELTERIKQATTKADYGFVRKPGALTSIWNVV